MLCAAGAQGMSPEKQDPRYHRFRIDADPVFVLLRIAAVIHRNCCDIGVEIPRGSIPTMLKVTYPLQPGDTQ